MTVSPSNFSDDTVKLGASNTTLSSDVTAKVDHPPLDANGKAMQGTWSWTLDATYTPIGGGDSTTSLSLSANGGSNLTDNASDPAWKVTFTPAAVDNAQMHGTFQVTFYKIGDYQFKIGCKVVYPASPSTGTGLTLSDSKIIQAIDKDAKPAS